MCFVYLVVSTAYKAGASLVDYSVPLDASKQQARLCELCASKVRSRSPVDVAVRVSGVYISITSYSSPRRAIFTLLDSCVSSLRRGHANLLCIAPILTDDPRRESNPTQNHLRLSLF